MKNLRDGKANFENGALLRSINHIWFNRLSRREQEELNQLFIQYRQLQLNKFKLNFMGLTISTEKDVQVDKIGSYSFEEQNNLEIPIIIPVKETTLEDIKRLNKFNRAKEKLELKKQLQEYLLEHDDR